MSARPAAAHPASAHPALAHPALAHPALAHPALAHPALARLASALSVRTPDDATPWPEARLAAVAAVLRVMDEPELLFIKRAEAPHDPWSGHVAFPGGRREPHDVSLEATAIRETREELDLDLASGHILGRLDDLAPRSRALPPIIVRPFVALVRPEVVFVPSREVAATFWVPLSRIRASDAQVEHVTEVNGVRARFPAYALHGHVVWGLTERIVRQLLPLFD
jgi:8-oxo-dGTP pyrophosphatase MutT (NUDIX family)